VNKITRARRAPAETKQIAGEGFDHALFVTLVSIGASVPDPIGFQVDFLEDDFLFFMA